MFDTAVTLIGNVMTAPEWRRTSQTGTYVVTFRFASTSRRYDRATSRWVDGDSLRIKVACWRKLGENVFESVQLGDPLVTEEHITAFGWATPQDLDDVVALALRVNDFLFGLFLGCGIKLIDFKIEFGRLYEDDMVRIVLADEISPDSCRLWDLRTNEKMDKDRFRRDLGKVEEAYQEVARRLGILIDQGPGDVRGPTTLQ